MLTSIAVAVTLLGIFVSGIDQDWPIVDEDLRPRWYGVPLGRPK